jgi:hypothetical protein
MPVKNFIDLPSHALKLTKGLDRAVLNGVIKPSSRLFAFISPSEPLPARPALYLPARGRRPKISLNGGSGDTGGGKHEII